MNRKLLGLILGMSIGVSFGCHTGKTSSVTIANRGADTIISATVKICGQVLLFGSIAPAGHATLLYRANFDSDYDVTLLRSGGKIAKKIGYVTNGFCFVDTIFVLADSISISPHSANKCK
jgi:hypothetical protein